MSACWTTLVSAPELAAALAERAPPVVVVDARFSLAAPAAGEAAYRASRIPDARYAHLDRDLSAPKHDARAGRHPWPDAAAFAAQLADWGIGAETQVVAYDDGDGAYAARLWFLLQAFGHACAAVLDGGWVRWTALGLPVDDAPPPPAAAPQEAIGTARFEASRLLDAAGVQAHLDAGGLLVDARAAERFRGEIEPIDRIAGHVPGAANRPYAANLENGGFKSAARLAEEFRALLGAHSANDLVAMCGSGVTACHHLLAMAHAGLPGAKLYTASWSGWSADPSRPVATGAE
jgi:thiosulfate/3-mercaptopyruvate sulfurtransferase